MDIQDEYNEARRQKDKVMKALRVYEQEHPADNPDAVEYISEPYGLLLSDYRKADIQLEDAKKRLGN